MFKKILQDKKLFYMSISLFILVIAFISLLITQNQINSTNPVQKNHSTVTPSKNTAKAEPKIKKSDFQKDVLSKDTTVSTTNSSVGFDKESLLKRATVSNTNPVLIQATKNYLLFKSFEDTLYLYHLDTDKFDIIDSGVNQAYIDSNEKYVVFSKNFLSYEKVYSYKIGENLPREVMSVTQKVRLTSLVSNNGLIVYTYHPYGLDVNLGPFTTVSHIIPEFNAQYGSTYQNAIVPNTYSFSTVYSGAFYYIDSATKDIKKTTIQIPNQTVYNIPNKNFVMSPTALVFKNQDWVLLDHGQLMTNKGILPNYQEVKQVAWLDNDHFVFISSLNLYLVDKNTFEVKLIKTNVQYVKTYDGNLYFETSGNQVYKTKEK